MLDTGMPKDCTNSSSCWGSRSCKAERDARSVPLLLGTPARGVLPEAPASPHEAHHQLPQLATRGGTVPALRPPPLTPEPSRTIPGSLRLLTACPSLRVTDSPRHALNRLPGCPPPSWRSLLDAALASSGNSLRQAAQPPPHPSRASAEDPALPAPLETPGPLSLCPLAPPASREALASLPDCEGLAARGSVAPAPKPSTAPGTPGAPWAPAE